MNSRKALSDSPIRWPQIEQIIKCEVGSSIGMITIMVMTLSVVFCYRKIILSIGHLCSSIGGPSCCFFLGMADGVHNGQLNSVQTKATRLSWRDCSKFRCEQSVLIRKLMAWQPLTSCANNYCKIYFFNIVWFPFCSRELHGDKFFSPTSPLCPHPICVYSSSRCIPKHYISWFCYTYIVNIFVASNSNKKPTIRWD